MISVKVRDLSWIKMSASSFNLHSTDDPRSEYVRASPPRTPRPFCPRSSFPTRHTILEMCANHRARYRLGARGAVPSLSFAPRASFFAKPSSYPHGDESVRRPWLSGSGRCPGERRKPWVLGKRVKIVPRSTPYPPAPLLRYRLWRVTVRTARHPFPALPAAWSRTCSTRAQQTHAGAPLDPPSGQ